MTTIDSLRLALALSFIVWTVLRVIRSKRAAKFEEEETTEWLSEPAEIITNHLQKMDSNHALYCKLQHDKLHTIAKYLETLNRKFAEYSDYISVDITQSVVTLANNIITVSDLYFDKENKKNEFSKGSKSLYYKDTEIIAEALLNAINQINQLDYDGIEIGSTYTTKILKIVSGLNEEINTTVIYNNALYTVL